MQSSTLPSPASSASALPRAERERLFRLEAERFRRSNPDLLTWSVKVRVEEREPLDFDAFPFQVELYEAFGDRSLPTVDVMKSAQCGISAAAVSLGLYAADVWQGNVLYVLPTKDFSYKFSDTRVKTAVEDSPYLRDRVASTDSKGLKKVGDAFVWFVGSVAEADAISIPADVLVLDEYDKLQSVTVPLFEKRLNSPKSLKLQRRFSNPTYPEDGIHRLFLDSDQRMWLIRCPRCRHEAPIFYEPGDEHSGCHVVDEGQKARVCGRCSRPLPLEVIAGGRWVAARPDVDARGYHISQLVIPFLDVPGLIKAHHRTPEGEVQSHYNMDLGLPYSPKGGSLSSRQVEACRRDYDLPHDYSGASVVTAGVDVGKVLHVRISRWTPEGQAVALFLGEVDDFTDLAQLWRRYNVNFGLIDVAPEERIARNFVGEFRGRAKLIRWSGDEQRDPLVIDDEADLVIARRSDACDRLVQQIGEQRRLLPRNLPERYVSQMTAPHRVMETSARAQKVARYKNERADHYFFAEVHDLLAKEAGGAPAADAPGGEPETMRDRIGRMRGR